MGVHSVITSLGAFSGNYTALVVALLGLLLSAPIASAQEYSPVERSAPHAVAGDIREFPFLFDGYAGHWSRDEWSWTSARGLFVQSNPTARAAVWAMEEDLGSQLLLEELRIERGFIQKLAAQAFTVANADSLEDLTTGNDAGTKLVALLDRSPLAQELLKQLSPEHQFRRNRAFMTRYGEQNLFVLCCPTQEELDQLKSDIETTVALVRDYDLHRGIAGVRTNHLTITTGYQHNPFFLISLFRELGCTWVMTSGYNDWMLGEPVREALQEVDVPFVWVSGQYVTGGTLYGMDRYPDVQDNTVEQCLDWAEDRGGYFFANLAAANDDNKNRYSGYIVSGTGDQDRIAELAAPFISQTGDINRSAPVSMVVLLEKGAALTQDSLIQGILERRAVAVYPGGAVVGPVELRRAMQILLLEGATLESRFPGPLSLHAQIGNGALHIAVENLTEQDVNVTLSHHPSAGVSIREGNGPAPFDLKAKERRVLSVPIELLPESSDRNSLIQVIAESDAGQTRALAHITVPPIVNAHPLLFDTPGAIDYPISVWNPGATTPIPVRLAVIRRDNSERVLELERTLACEPWNESRDTFPLDLETGDYRVEVAALGVTATGLVSIRTPEGTASTRLEDLNGDGVDEIIMENEHVRVAVLRTGGRVIEYTLKDSGENVFFKLWPEKPPMHGKVGGVRQFYPFGGLEEFIGYPYIGGHTEFRYEILQAEGDKARVRIWANIHGSEISKIYTLYGGGPVLEARYAFSNMTPSLNVIGINPLFELGKSTGPEDRYYFPEDELVETRPELERYYGRATFPREGWTAGYDTEEDVALVIAYPVDNAIYLHLWNNHPDNTPTPYYYTELQPWIELDHGTTTYFSYYVLGDTGSWEALRDTFADYGLVTTSTKDAPWQR
ncbi:MAG: hypothetical protein AMXMBFR82_45100 [Candidatus Hydrogenedentota bacterium]